MGKSARPADEETHDLVSHVRFETEVLAVVLDRSGGEDPSTYTEKIDRSVELNAAWIALRGLLAFFANDRKDADVIARAYVPGWHWKNVDGLTREFRDSKLRKRISQSVAHITANRLRDVDPLPDLSKVRDQVDLLLADFYDKVDDKDKHEFHPSLAAALEHVRTANPDGSARS